MGNDRQLTDVGNAVLAPERQGEIYHRYMLGVYEMQERLCHDFPDLLLENCSGGGARFGAGMLYYSPQIWCSDDMDPVERLSIQEGTALVYPLSSMGAHVCDCPNHTTGRTTPFQTRGKLHFPAHLVMSWISQKLRKKSVLRFLGRSPLTTSIMIWCARATTTGSHRSVKTAFMTAG